MGKLSFRERIIFAYKKGKGIGELTKAESHYMMFLWWAVFWSQVAQCINKLEWRE